MLQGSGANAPFTTLGGLDNTWVQGRRATRFFINDNLAWTVGAHEFRFGTNSRIFRLNDYDFGEGAVPLVTYTTLPQFIYGVASTASETFPLANSQPYNFLNLDFYAQDTWKVTRTLTWTFGIRDTYNSNPLNPHDAVARLAGSFDSISHDVNQPLEPGDPDAAWERFSPRRPLAILQPRTAIAWQIAPHTVLRSGFGLFSDLLPGSVADLVGTNPPYSKTFQGGLLGTVGGTAIAPGVPNSAIDATAAANQLFNSGFAQGRAFLRLAAGESERLPAADFDHRRSGWQAPCALLHAVELCAGTSDRQHAQSARSVCRHARRQPALRDASERLSDGLPGLLRAVPLRAARSIPASAPVTQLNTGANSHYNGLQLTADKRLGHGIAGPGQLHLEPLHGHGLERRIPAVRRRSAFFRRCRASLRRQYGPCDYDVRHNFTAQYVYQLPIKFRNRMLARALNGWQVSGTAFWHSGLPFSVLSAPYSANGNGIVQGSGPQYASVVPGVPLYEHNPIPGVTQPGTIQWLNPNAFVSAVDPSTGACAGGDSPTNCQFGNLGRNALRGPDFVWSDLYLTKWFQLTEHVKLRIDGQFFNVFNHPNFGLPVVGYAGIPGKPSTQTGFGALSYPTSPPTGLLGVGLGGDSSPRMIAFQARLEF